MARVPRASLSGPPNTHRHGDEPHQPSNDIYILINTRELTLFMKKNSKLEMHSDVTHARQRIDIDMRRYAEM